MSESDFERALDELASRICAAERAPVSVDTTTRRLLEQAISSGTLLEDEGGLRFADESQLVNSAAQHVLRNESSQLLSTAKACFKRLDEIAGNEIGQKKTVSGHVLATLHNTNRLDAYVWARQAIEEHLNVFDVLHVMEGAVPLLHNARAEAISDFFAGHYERVKDDLAGGLLYAKLPSWLTEHPDVARELKLRHEGAPQERTASLYGCALHGLILNDFAAGFELTFAAAHDSDPLIGGPALHILGLVDYSDPAHGEALNRVIDDCAQIVRTPGHSRIGTALGALGRLITAAEKRVVDLLTEASKTEVPEALYRVSEVLWRGQKEFSSKEWFWPLLLQLAAAKPEHGGILRNIDFILMQWIRTPERQSRALEFLDAWIGKQAGESLRDAGLEEHFSSTFHNLAKQPQLLSKALTAWLLKDDARYPLIAQKAVSRLRVEGVSSLALHSELIDDLQPNEIRFLLRRILGYIVGDEVQIRLVFSLVHTQNAMERTFPWVKGVLKDRVGYDYPYQTIEFLEDRQRAQEESEEVKALCRESAAELQGHLDTLEALPRLKEYQASSSKVRRFAKERRKQMNQAFDEASKDSIWRQIASNVTLKAGRRTFQSINGKYTEPMELKSMSHAMALPRSEISDPAGAARERLLYRSAKKDTP